MTNHQKLHDYMRTILPIPDVMTREEFLDAFKKELQKSIKDQKITVRFIGHTLFMEVNAPPQVVLDVIFVPLLDHQPRWEVTYTGWHHLFINHRTWSVDYTDLLNKITPAYGKGSKGLAKTYRGKSCSQIG